MSLEGETPALFTEQLESPRTNQTLIIKGNGPTDRPVEMQVTGEFERMFIQHLFFSSYYSMCSESGHVKKQLQIEKLLIRSGCKRNNDSIKDKDSVFF